MALAIRLGALLMPIDYSLVRHNICVVQHLQNLDKGLDNAGICIAIYLDGIDEIDLRLG